jgi:hypothetical protein
MNKRQVSQRHSVVVATIAIALSLGTFRQSLATPPSNCNERDISAYGRPVTIQVRKDLYLGVSLPRREFKAGEPIEVHIWAVNSGDSPAGVWTCEDLEHFKEWGIDIFGKDGRRILRQFELENLGQCSTLVGRFRMSKAWSCLRNFPINIPAHSCVTGKNYDFLTDLTSSYRLPPGKYILRLQPGWDDTRINLCDAHDNKSPHTQPNDLTFRVTKP